MQPSVPSDGVLTLRVTIHCPSSFAKQQSAAYPYEVPEVIKRCVYIT